MSSITHNIVVIGRNFAGVGISHYILRHIIPSAAANTGKKYKLIVISPSTHYSFKVAVPRALAQPEVLDKLFVPFDEAFESYGDLFDYVQGEAVGLDTTNKLVNVRNNEGSSSNVSYDSLIIATGTRSVSPLWTLHGSHTITLDAIRDTTKAITKAKTILIAGGGPTGVETAGEIGYKGHVKDITLLSGSTQLLNGLNTKGVGKSAESHLKKLKVKTIHNVKVISATNSANGATALKLSDGTTRTVDLYIDATGGKPNTDFLPKEWLDDRGAVLVNVETLRATKAPVGVYSLGDVASYSNRNILDVHRAIAPLGYSVWADLTRDAKVKSPLTEKLHIQDPKEMQIIAVGPKGGVGTMMGFSAPNFLVWLLKARTYFIPGVPKAVHGDLFRKVDVAYTPL